MHQEKFQKLFKKISSELTLDMIAKDYNTKGKIVEKLSSDLIWDAIDILNDFDFIILENGQAISCNRFFKRPVRILFFVMLSEFENRLFRIHERVGKPISELNEKNLNDLIRELVDSDLIKLQHEYKERSKFKEDMKAISSFRNVIMHVNKKGEKDVHKETLVERKKQLCKLLSALQQISDNMTSKDCESLRNNI